MATVLLVPVLVSCSAGPSSPHTKTSTPPPPVAAVTAEPPVEAWLDDLDLSFENGEVPARWSSGVSGQGPLRVGQGYDYEPDRDIFHAGNRSLRIAGHGDFGAVSQVLPLDKVRGKHVRLSGWLKTKEVTKFSGLWLRIDGPAGLASLGFDNMAGRGPSGTTDWTRYELGFDVPEQATAVVFGALLVGDGAAWVDDLHIELGAVSPAQETQVHGRVTDSSGKPVVGAVVAANRADSTSDIPGFVTRSGADGGFAFDLKNGMWAFTATSDAGVAVYRAPAWVSDDVAVELTLGDQGFTVSGRVDTRDPLPDDALVVASRYSHVSGDLFVTRPAADGRYSVRLPAAAGYTISFTATGMIGQPSSLPTMDDQVIDLSASRLAPPPPEVVDWVKNTAIPVTTVEAGHGLDDLAPLSALVGAARIVALGEATHGTREFFQMKHRVLEYLVEKKGFRLFAIEANLTEARRVNDYVLHGKGTAAQALAGMYFWIWDTEEVLALIEWMRAYNLDARHRTKVQFLGIDMQTTAVAWANVHAYLGRVDPEYDKTLPESVDLFGIEAFRGRWNKLSAEERSSARAKLNDLVARLDAQRQKYTRASSREDWRRAREDARLVAQAAALDASRGTSGFLSRDAAMAENVGWILDHEAKGSKMVLWAHNGHVATRRDFFDSMGLDLRRKYGKDYLVLGFMFAQGGFRARGTAQVPSGTAVRDFSVGPAPDTHASAAFSLAGEERCILDLRRAPAGPVADWFGAAHLVREIGAVFSGEASMAGPQSLSREYDGIVFVRDTTPSRPNPTGRRDQ